jgi:zinc transport system substrate-binding protein
MLCIFSAPNHDPALASFMVDGTEARIGAPLDPEGSMLEPGPSLYGAVLSGMADALTGCLSES